LFFFFKKKFNIWLGNLSKNPIFGWPGKFVSLLSNFHRYAWIDSVIIEKKRRREEERRREEIEVEIGVWRTRRQG